MEADTFSMPLRGDVMQKSIQDVASVRKDVMVMVKISRDSLVMWQS